MSATDITNPPMPQVKGGLLRYIIPFWLEWNEREGFAQCVQKLDESGPIPIEEFEPWHHLYEYILDCLRPDGGGAPLGRAWTCPLPERISLHCDKPKAPIASAFVETAGLMLFTTGVGFFWFDISDEGGRMKHLGACQLSEALWLQQHLSTAWNERYPTSFLLGGEKLSPLLWARNLLSGLLQQQVYFFDSKELDGVSIPYRLLHFADAVISGPDDQPLSTRCCQLARGFGYKSIPAREVCTRSFTAFEGTCIHVGREGCAYMANDSAPVFSKSDFLGRYERCYFWIYLLMLQQSYALKLFARRISESTSADPDADAEDTNRLLLEITGFLVRNEFASVSDIDHINDFYRYGRAQLNIQEESRTLHDGLNAITQLRNSTRQKQEDQREKQADDRLEWALALLALLAVISAVCDSVGLITGILDASLRGGWWVAVGFMWLVVAGIVFLAFRLFTGRGLPQMHFKHRRKTGRKQCR